MDSYGKNSQNGGMSLEEVLEMYDGKETSQETGTSLPVEIENPPVHKTRKPVPKKRRRASFAEASSWFQTICWLNIPVFGFFYMFVLLIRKKTPVHKKNFIIGYIMYKVLVWLLAIVLAYWLYKTGLDFIDGMLGYIT